MDWVENINILKKGTGKTNHEISELSGIPKSTVDKVFSGHSPNPNLDTIRSILHAMGCNLNTLFSIDVANIGDGKTTEPSIAKLTQVTESYKVAPEPIRQAVDKLLDIE